MSRRLVSSIGIFLISATTCIAFGCSMPVPRSIPLIEEFPIYTHSSPQGYGISNNIVSWVTFQPNGSRGDVCVYNLSSNAETFFNAGCCQPFSLAISGNIVVWTNSNIYGYNISSDKVFLIYANDSSSSFSPAISGNIVVWENIVWNADATEKMLEATLKSTIDWTTDDIAGNTIGTTDTDVPYSLKTLGDIYGFDLARNITFPVCINSSIQSSPAIDGPIIVWQDERNGNADIYGYDLETGAEFPICTNTSAQWNPAISGNIVVWTDQSGISGYNLATHAEFPICTNAGNQWDPAISGNVVVWADSRNGNWDIYGYNLATQTEFPICTNENYQCEIAISGNIVAWQEWDEYNGGYNIYGARLIF